jgi:hypothetical protein
MDTATFTRSASMSLSELAARITYNGGENVSSPPSIPNLPGFYIRQSAGNTVTKEFGVDVFDVVLDRAPLSNVVLSLNTSAPGVAVLDNNSLTFTPANWNISQRVVLRGIDNYAVNDAQSVNITVAVVDVQSDATYHTVASQVFSALIVDDDLLPGDFDGNGSVNSADLSVWQGAYGVNAAADADGDGDSDGRDFLAWQRNVVPSRPGDFDGDADVDHSDLNAWQAAYGVNASADADHDGDSDGRDFLVWQRNYAPASATLQTTGQSHLSALANEQLIDAALALAISNDAPEQDDVLPVRVDEEIPAYTTAVDEAVAIVSSHRALASLPTHFVRGLSHHTDPQLSDELLDELF